MTEIKAMQVQQEADITQIKDIVQQQHQIKWHEERVQQCNLIVSNLPESDVTYDEVTYSDDTEKFVALVNDIMPDKDKQLSIEVVEEANRLGPQGNGKRPRILKVKLVDVDCRNA